MFHPRLPLAAAKIGILLSFACVYAGAIAALALEPEEQSSAEPLNVVVMDPLAKQLSCPCVAGYAQRDYEALGAALEDELKRKVVVSFHESLTNALRENQAGDATLIIGKHSVVLYDLRKNKFKAHLIASLTGKDGSTTQTGLVVVPKDDPARSVADLKKHLIILGPADCDEKHKAARKLFQKHGIKLPAEPEISNTCSQAVLRVLELHPKIKSAAIISSYAQPLLEGCGTIEKGDVRSVGETAPVPFISAFVASQVAPADRKKISDALIKVTADPVLRLALESKDGFVRLDPQSNSKENSTTSWSDWRGPDRDGHAAWLPEKLPSKVAFTWQRSLNNLSMGGIAATERYVVVGDRDLADSSDLFRCLNTADGSEVWTLVYHAPANLDYGNGPRATPRIAGNKVYLCGAMGQLHCVDLHSGRILWQKNLPQQFGADDERPWGYASTPLLVDNKLIVNPGGSESSLVALDPDTGEVLWQTPGQAAAFSSFIVGVFGGKRQIVGYDKHSLGGWDIKTGRRLWTLEPPHKGDFNVPTPIAYNGQLIVTTENNGTRIYEFDSEGRLVPTPVATHMELAPDSHTPVVVGNRLFGVWMGLYCLDVQAGLKQLWVCDDEPFNNYASIIASRDRVLITTLEGKLLLLDGRSDQFKLISSLDLFPDELDVWAHPALVGENLYVRSSTKIACLKLTR